MLLLNTDDTLMKLHVHTHTIVINNQYKFHEIPFIYYLVMAQDYKKTLKNRQSKDNNSVITDDIPIYVHNLILVIYIQYKFYEIPSIGYLFMAEDQMTDGQKDGRMEECTPL